MPLTYRLKLSESDIDRKNNREKKYSKDLAVMLSLLKLGYRYFFIAKLLQKSEMRKDIVIELSYKGFG